MVLAMDTHLKLLAEASLHVTAAEEAVAQTAYQTAREELDRAEEQLDALRAGWPEMSGPERAIVGPTAKSLKERVDAAARRIPKRTTLSEGTAEADPEEEIEPAA
jgi:hypothetical protein